jgi:hypothetical protein
MGGVESKPATFNDERVRHSNADCTQGFSEFQRLKVFCMFGSVKSAKHASRSMGPSTTHFMSERLTTSVAGIWI